MAPVLIVAVFGLFIGSFLNVCIHRIPRDKSIVWPASSCPKCSQPIKPWDNIPVLSYIILLGRCRGCREFISPRYPLVEMMSSLFAVGLFLLFGQSASFVIYYVWACALLIITFIDLDFQIIPDSLSIGGIVVGLCLVYWLPVTYKDALIGLFLGAGGLWAIIVVYYLLTGKEGMGGGDVKLLGMIGVFTGWHGVLYTIFMGSLIGSLIGVPWALINKKGMQAPIPFGPFLAMGALMYLFFGQDMINWYFGTITR